MLELLVLLLLVFPIIAIAAFLIALRDRSALRHLESRIARLEVGPQPLASPRSVRQQPPAVEQTSGAVAQLAEAPISQPRTTSIPSPAASPPTRAAVTRTPSQIGATLEERFGTQWVVWIGGLALALGAIFLVRYTVEQGLLGPGVRIALAGLFAAALIAAGEWTRRKEIDTGVTVISSRHIPSILTAAGTIAGYATVYAAYALYEFLSPGAAFILLGLVALATLMAALLHGPGLAGLGVAGAFVTPLLVASQEPNYWALYIYLFVINAAAFALARMRLWRWLAIAAVVLGALWTLPGAEYGQVEALGAHLFHATAGFTLAAALIVSGLLYGPNSEPGRPDGISSGAVGAYILAATVLVIGSLHASIALAVFTMLTAATVAIAWRTDAALYALPAAGLTAIVVMVHWTVPHIFVDLVLPPGPARGAVPDLPTGAGSHVAFGVAVTILFGFSGFAAQRRAHNAVVALIWSATATITSVAILIALYLRIAEFDRSIPFAGLALLVAALFGHATETLSKREPRSGIAGSASVFATGAVASLALAFTFALEKGWLTVALALMVPGIAWVSEQRPLPALRYVAAAIVVLVVLRVGFEPRIVGGDIGTTPIFNWLLYGYGVPAASFWYGGYLLRKRADDASARTADSAAILFTVLLAFLEVRHFMTNGHVFERATKLAEVAMQVSVGLALTIGLERLCYRTQSVVHDIGALIVGGLTFVGIIIGLLLTLNPLLKATEVGGPFLNLILLGYGIPALLSAILALVVRASRPPPYHYVAAATAIVLALLYLSLEVRRLFHGSLLAPWEPTGDAEQYTKSVVWLVFGIVLLATGFVLRSQPARFASAAVVAVTICKVFFIDMAGLTGIFRALSFIGLGAVLVGIGWLYQRLLFPADARAIRSAAEE
jgi:uncharacterized membrane protein